MPQDIGIPGNAYAEQLELDRMLHKIGAAIMRGNSYMEKNAEAGTYIRKISLASPWEKSGEWFVVITKYEEGMPLVAFHSADTLQQAVVGLLNRLRNGSLKWRTDEYGDK